MAKLTIYFNTDISLILFHAFSCTSADTHLFLPLWPSDFDCVPLFLSHSSTQPFNTMRRIDNVQEFLHFPLFLASFSSSLQDFPVAFNSCSVWLQLTLGLPLFLFPWGFHFSACLVTLSSGLLFLSLPDKYQKYMF